MATYVIVDIGVTDAATYEQYKRLAGPTVGQYGGRYLVRGGGTEVVEGDWSPKRLVILEFGSAAQARAWLDSPEYRVAKGIRHRSATTRMVLVEGV